MKDRTLLVLVVAASLLIKIPIALFLINGFGIDESLYIATAKDYVELGVFGVTTEAGNQDFRFIAPLVPFTMSIFQSLFGDVGPLLVGPIMSSVLIIPFYYLGKIALGRKYGILAAILLLVNPAYLLLSTRALTEGLGLLLFTTAILVFLVALKQNKYWIFALPMILVTFLARYPYGVLLVAVMIVVLLFEKKLKNILNYHMAAGLLIALVLAAPWFMYNLDEFGNIVGGPTHQGTDDVGFDFQKAWWYFPYMFIIAGATLPFLFYGFMHNIHKRKLIFFLVGLIVIFLVQFFAFGKTVEERYILPVLPFVTIIAISGYVEMRKFHKKASDYAMVAFIIINVAAGLYLVDLFGNLPRYVDTESAAPFILENCSPVLLGNVFTPIYHSTGYDVVQSSFDPETDLAAISEHGINCVIVSPYESPYENFFESYSEGYTENSFGRVSVYVKN